MPLKINKIPILTINHLVRFWSKIDKISKSPCWLWLGSYFTRYDGISYGRFRIGKMSFVATRISYFIYYKIDPGELLVCHDCNHPYCVNPDHLFLGNDSLNQLHAFVSGIQTQKGIFNSNCKLTNNDIQEIRNSIEPINTIAAKYDICRSYVSAIKTGRARPDVI